MIRPAKGLSALCLSFLSAARSPYQDERFIMSKRCAIVGLLGQLIDF